MQIDVAVGYNLDLLFTYNCNDNVRRGSIVKVPFGNKVVYAIVINIKSQNIEATFNIKDIIEASNIILSDKLMQYFDWLRKYNMLNLGSCAKIFLPPALESSNSNKKEKLLYALKQQLPDQKTTPKNQIVIDKLKNLYNDYKPLDEIHKITNVSKNVITRMVEKGFFATRPQKISNFSQDYNYLPPIFNPHQQLVIQNIKNLIATTKPKKPILLQGVTGSGKTEIYYNIAADMLKNKKSVLILLPEIALSRQIIKNFTKRFKIDPIVWHSRINGTVKAENYKKIIKESSYIIVGTRSALNLPINNLSLIIIDEEHDTAYKQEVNPIYNARDMAVVRGSIEDAQVLLISATPSMESILNCQINKYFLIKLDHKFKKGIEAAKIQIIDMRAQKNDTRHMDIYSSTKTNRTFFEYQETINDLP